MNRYNRIKQKLDVLKPHYLEIIDESYLHIGHQEHLDYNETHFKIKISSVQLEGLTLVAQHKTIQSILKDEFNLGLHALSINVIKKGR